jgi:hypothetical protein
LGKFAEGEIFQMAGLKVLPAQNTELLPPDDDNIFFIRENERRFQLLELFWNRKTKHVARNLCISVY